jgi:flagellar hook-associated protein 1 FlgK
LLLAGIRASTVTYVAQGSAAAGQTYPRLQIELDGSGLAVDLEGRLASGSLRGLIDARDRDLPAIGASLGELAGKVTDALNAVHNNATTVPAQSVLAGKTTGLLGTDALGFSGRASVAIVDGNGALVRRVDINFDTGTLSVNGGAPSALGASIGTFVTALNGALGTNGSASFVDGKLTVAATGGNGVLAQDDLTTPALRGGQGFGGFFGLNDLVRTSGPSNFATGLGASDAHGFTPGQQLGFRILNENGSVAANRTITVAAGNLGALVAQLNDVNTGLGAFATFSLDAQGRLIQTPTTSGLGQRIEVALDTTTRGTIGLSFTSLFGVGDAARASRASSAALVPTISTDASKLAFAQADLSGKIVGDRIVGASDSRGAQALARIASTRFSFDLAGSLSAASMTLGDYAARLAGDIAQKSASADGARDNAQRTQDQVVTARSNVEGVNLDEELVKLTTYQQSYNAAARLITAASDLYDTLLSMMR